MATAIMLREHGGPEVLRTEPIEVAAPGPGRLLLRQTAVGVNFHDCYVRSGLYRTLPQPGVPGIEAAGVAAALFEVLSCGADQARTGIALPLHEAARAHHLLESRQAESPLILLPQEDHR